VSAAAAAQRWPNLSLKKIPKVVLARCEWGRDDYSLNVQNLPLAQTEQPVVKAPVKKYSPSQAVLFGEDEP
jgi:adenine-specific DNA-methyltransferase